MPEDASANLREVVDDASGDVDGALEVLVGGPLEVPGVVLLRLRRRLAPSRPRLRVLVDRRLQLTESLPHRLESSSLSVRKRPLLELEEASSALRKRPFRELDTEESSAH